MSTLKERYEGTIDEVARVALSCGRDPAEIRIIAVSKEEPVETIGEGLAEAGIRDFAENRTAIMLPKIERYPEAIWHFVGKIQSRQVKNIVGYVSLIHSVDREDIIEKLERRAASLDIVQAVLLEVNVSGEESKSGFDPDEVAPVIARAGEWPHLHICGLMTMAPRADEECARATFRGLRELRDGLIVNGVPSCVDLSELSMGMSEDFRFAIEEGSTMVRIGRRIFDEEFTEFAGGV